MERGYPPLQLGGVWGAEKVFDMSFEMLNFNAFWTLKQGDSIATVSL